jgi:hypothetical protein
MMRINGPQRTSPSQRTRDVSAFRVRYAYRNEEEERTIRTFDADSHITGASFATEIIVLTRL